MRATTVFSLRTLIGASAVAGALVVAVAPVSSAATATPGVPGVSSTDVSAASQAAASPVVVQRLGGFFAQLGPAGAPLAVHAAAPAAAAAAAQAPHLVGTTVPVYYLDPAFVTAKYGTAAVAKQEFMATAAVSASGQRASVWTARSAAHPPNTWTEFNIASGSTETDMAAAAAKLGPGAIAFYEPQIHAWYGLLKDHVTPLNNDAVRSVGSAGISLLGYQRLVHGRYADKVPGTAYADKHMLGGFSRGPVKASGSGGSTEIAVGAASAAALAGLYGIGFAVRRQRGATFDAG
ncbi:hypothetical protein ABH935_000441 [Catenulispora sp. GAS73]|uniref:hypothetical protein n=1 Tax=Catenulispora sp. GAS73 TaxID=3156269 RepID=UPI0035158466